MNNPNRAFDFTPTEQCEAVQKHFHTNWLWKSSYLTVYLETLERLKCLQKYQECERRYAQFNAFTELIYDQSCDRHRLIDKCYADIQSVVTTLGRSERANISSSWNYLVTELNALGPVHLRSACVQAALYDRVIQERGYSFGAFEEAKELQLPFCGALWCGVDTAHAHLLSPALCACTRSIAASEKFLDIFR